ncbi:MAG: hypothetical protein MK239_08525 [Gemmatimonadetes bacterium]|nr:hypothetical protein [Gemmatimonadota bacterium]
MVKLRLIVRSVAVAVFIVVLLRVGENSVPQTLESPTTPETSPASQPEARTSEPTGCFRLGDMRAQVRAAMGEPDSIAFRLQWFYEGADLTFDPYGTVIEYSDPDQILSLCER